MGNRHLFITIIVAVLIHVIFLYLYFYNNNVNEAAIDKGKDGLIVGVGITGSYSDDVKDQKNELEVLEKEKKVEAIIKPDAKPQVKQKTKPIVKPEPKTEVKQKTKPIVNPELKTEVKQKIKPIVKAEPKTEVKQKTKVNTQSEAKLKSKPKKEALSSSQKAQNARTATGIGKQKELGGVKSARQGYLSIIKAKISRAKKYPKSARREGIVGTVTLRFIIKLNGKVKNIKLIKSSGDQRLDKEAMKMLKRASPFPSIPKDISIEPFDLTLPIEFTLKTIKNKFY